AVFDQHPELAEMCPADGRTMLHQAAAIGALRWMKWLLDRGADVNRNSHRNWTPLDYAATGQGGPWVFDNQKFESVAALLLERGADPNANVWTSGSATYRAYHGRNPEMIALLEQYGGWIDPGSAGYARQVEIARKMLAGEIDPHLEPNDFSGRTVAEQLLWGGASSLCSEIVRMALEHVDWPADDPRWFWMLWRPVHGHDDYSAQQQADSCE